MQCPGDICVVIELRVSNRWSNARARSQVRNCINFLAVKQVSHRRAVPKIDVAHDHVLGKTSNIRVLNLWIVKIIEIVEDDHVVPVRQELLDKMRPDETGAACDQDSHGAKLATDDTDGHRFCGEDCRASVSVPKAFGIHRNGLQSKVAPLRKQLYLLYRK